MIKHEVCFCTKCNKFCGTFSQDGNKTRYCLSCRSRVSPIKGVQVVGHTLVNKSALGERLTIPEGVTAIYPDSLSETTIREIVFPASLHKIPYECFKNCRNLQELTIPQTITEIEGCAFEGCTSLEKVIIKGKAKVGHDAFKGCKNLRNVVIEDYKEIGWSAFEDCSNLKEVTIGGNIGDAWEACSIHRYFTPFDICRNLEKITFAPNAKIGALDLSKIPNLKKISILCPIKDQDVSAPNKHPRFCNCSMLEEVELTSIENIYPFMFSECVKLKKVTIGSSIGTIGYRAFDNCTSLESIRIPSGCIELSGFNDCINLKEVIIPSTTRKIGTCAFKNCKNLEFIAIPERVEELGESSFKNCTGLKELRLPSTLRKIGDRAFEDCTSLEIVSTSDGLLEIGEYAFSQCKKLKILRLPPSLERIGRNAFKDMPVNHVILPPKMKKLETGLKSKVVSRPDGLLVEAPIANGVLYYIEPKANKIIVPTGVESIDSFVVSEPEVITEVCLADSVKEIRPNAFANCRNIAKFVFGRNLEKIGSKAFMGTCEKLIDLPVSIKEIAPDAFGKGCVISVAGEMPFYGVALASIDKTRQELEGKEAAIAKLQDRAVMLETDLDSYINAMPPEFVDISQYKDQIDSIENTRAEHARIAAEKQSALTTKCKQIEADIEDLSAQHKRLFFLAVSKKKELDVSIQSKQNDLKLLQDKQKQLSEESASADKPLMDELASIKSKVKELESAQKRWEAKREALINAIAKAREGYQTELADLADMKAEIIITESALEKKHASWMAARDKVLLLESKRNLEREKATLLWNMQIPECDKITPYSFKPRKSVVEEVLLNEAYLAAIEDWNHENEVVVHNQFVERHTEKIKRVKEINISLKLPEDDGVSQFVTWDMPQLKSNYLPERFEKLNAYFAQKDFWKHFKRSTKDCVSKKKTKLCEKFFAESEYLCLSNGSVHLLLFPYCMVKYEAKKPLILLTYDKARFAVKYEEITETTDVIPPYGELLREQHMYLNADGSVSKRYKNNPIVKTIRFTTVTISEANMHFTCPFKALETALKFETAFNDYKNIFSGGEYCDIYKMILASADLGTIEDAIRNHDEAKKKLIAEEKERARAQHLSALAVAKEERKKLENERLAAQAAAEEKRRSLIQRQKELNEERKRQADEKKKIYSLFEDDADTTPEREEEAVETVAPLEVISKRQISNNVFKTQVKQTVQALPEETLCYFVTKDGTIISNKKKLANEGLGGEMTIGFVLTSGIDYTQMSACLMRIESKGVVLGEIDFKLNISFYSDF